MGFTGYPISTTTRITYDLVIQLWQAWWRRKIAMGQIYWPPPDAAFPGQTDNGTVAAVAQGTSTLTVTCNRTASWDVAANNVCGPKRWVNYVCEPCPLKTMPAFYDLIVMVDFWEPRTHVRMPILDQVAPTSAAGTGQLIVDPTALLNAVTAGYVDSVDSLTGAEYYIQKRGGAWITDRWPERPDDQQLWIGGGSSGTGHFGDDPVTVYATLTDPDAKWTLNAWSGMQAMIFAGGVLRRLTILQNDATTLYFANDASAAGVGGQYAIVAPGGKCTPGRPAWNYQQWMSGAGEIEAGHLADDSLSTVAVPKRSVDYFSGDPCTTGSCGEFPRTEQLFDPFGNQLDYQIAYDDLCAASQAGNYVSRNVWKSLRMLQTDIEASCTAFLPVLGDGGTDEGKAVINAYTPATLFRDMGCPNGTATTQFFTTSTDPSVTPPREYGYYYFVAGGDFIGRAVRWTITDATGKNVASGIGTPDAAGRVTGVLDAQYGKNPANVGLAVVYALPWLRVRPRWVRYLYPKTGFRPAIGADPEGSEPRAIDPPVVVRNDDGTCDGSLTGTWVRRGASAGGLVSRVGRIGDVEPFVAGELYRYIGDNYRDPFPGGPTEGDASLANPYENKFYRGRLSPEHQSARDAGRSGVVVSGTTYSLTALVDWWSDLANTGGTLRVETGVATAGSATQLVDAAKDTTNPNLPHASWWDTVRFPGEAFAGFVLEVDQQRTVDGVATTVTTKLPITGTLAGAAGVTVRFDAVPGFAVHTGDVYRIAEPAYELNKWQDRTVTVTAPDGTVVVQDEPIRFSDRNTLYLAPRDTPIPVGSKFTIAERQPGVYRWTGSEFVVATGPDAARVTVQTAVDFLPDPNANNNGWLKDYGLIEYGDLAHVEVLNELYRAIDLLRDTKAGMDWTSRSNPLTPHKNVRRGRANLPFWTEDPTLYQYYVDSSAGSGVPMTDVAYDNAVDAWKRCWSAVFDYNDPYHTVTQEEYEDHQNGGDGTIEIDGLSPRQCGQYEYCYAYIDRWEYPGYYYPGCAHATYWDDSVLNAFLIMDSVEAFGKVNALPGFRKLAATVSGVVYSAIAPGDPDWFDFDASNTRDYCGANDRTWVNSQFQDAGSGAQFRKWHVYGTWGVPTGTITPVTGPKYGSKSPLGEPDVKRHKCRPQTCTAPDGSTYKPFEQFDDNGQMGWCVIDQFARVSWDMEGF